MKLVVAMLIVLLTAIVCLADGYQFPAGVPVKASEVTFYRATERCQDERGGWKALNDQSWNKERPWVNAGMEDSPNVRIFKFYRPGNGGIREWNEIARYFDNGGYYRRWSYPAGTLFGEIIQADGMTVEIFTLEFKKNGAEPTFHRYRPYATREELAPYIVSERLSEGSYGDSHGRKVPMRGQTGRNGENMDNVLARSPVISVRGLVHEVELSKEGVETILRKPFKDVIDVPFSQSGELKSFAPTTKQRRGIVPVNTASGFFSSAECLTCHRTAGAEGRLLDPDPVPDKYGNLRGNGFVFSFEPQLNRKP